MIIVRITATIIAVALISSCATRPYVHESIESVPFRDRAVTQVEGNIHVTAAVPDVAETSAIFGLPLYDRGIQPVWLEIENRGDTQVRFAPHGLDPAYYPPLEVAWGFRGKYSKTARSEMERYLYDSGMPRRIFPGETRSGFVYTRARPGTKGFNVDVFGDVQDHSFTFFIDVPGFVPDHSAVDFDALYRDDEIKNVSISEAFAALAKLPCCANDKSGEVAGAPVNVILIGSSEQVLQGLLRAGWYETARAKNAAEEKTQKRGQYLRGRPADAVFRIVRESAGERNELRLWLAPTTVDNEQVWAGQISHYMSRVIGSARLDPDVDDARMYMAQTMWFAQALRQFGWAKGADVVPIGNQRRDINGAPFFTDGYRAVMWVSGDPVSMLEVMTVGAERPTHR
jgi:hypothetical protein